MKTATAAYVVDGVVENVIVVEVDDEGKTDFEVDGAEIVVLSETDLVTLGWRYDKGKFTDPEE